MRITVAAGEDGLARLSTRLDAFCASAGLAVDVRHDLHLVVDEVVNNIIRHASPRHPVVTIDLTTRDDELEIRIVDDGDAFDPRTRPDPDTSLALEDRPVGGLGIFLVRQLMDVQYERRKGRNRLTLRRRLSAGPAGSV